MRALLACLLLTACATTHEANPSADPSTAPLTFPPTTTVQVSHEAVVAPAAAKPEAGYVLQNARLIDGTGAKPRDNVDVLVKGDRIAAIGTDLQVPAGATVIDLGGRTLLPGFIDAHVHLTFSPAPSYAESVRESVQSSDADRALEGVANARATLLAGFTTVRNVGGTFADRALRDAIASGKVPGPRMLVANHAIGITGGHCDDSNSFDPSIMPRSQDFQSGVADGPQEVRKAVRYQIKHGADVIKLCATGGVMSQGDAVGASQLTVAEMQAAVDEAVRADRRVAAHAHGTAGIKEAVQAGVHSIEHGSVLDDAAIRQMKARGTFLVPTSYVGRYVLEQADKGTLSAHSAQKARHIAPKMKDSFARAHAAGVRIALGSDAGVFEHGLNAREFTTMVALGMTPIEAIVAGTATGAELLGLGDVGKVEKSYMADLVVVADDPLQDIETLEEPVMVMKGGVLHLPPTWDAAQ